ncbi:MAG TPA: flagellar basal body rod protein FlgC [Gaiellaceae bacterium]|nr:flagellar basal body rod protein FlgC [Gaiellaceae bacterium]
MSNLFGSLSISASGMTADRLRMDVVAENLANADTTEGADGKPYQRKEVLLQEVGGSPSFADVLDGAQSQSVGDGVEVTGIVNDQSPGKKVYDPGNPDADKQGYVTMPNVDPVNEMVDLIGSSRGYEANVQALDASKQMFTKALTILGSS